MKKQKDDAVYIADMLLEIKNIGLFCSIGNPDETLLTYALIRALTILGEAAKRVADATRAKAPDIPWQHIIGLRNVLSHEYEDIHIDRLWQIIERDLPPLKSSLLRLYKELTGNEYAD